MLVAHLYHNARVLGKQCLDDVAAANVVQVDVHTALFVGETHLKERRYESACAYIVSGENQTAVYKFLNGIEAVDEILRILNCRHVASHLSEALSERAAAQTLLVE